MAKFLNSDSKKIGTAPGSLIFVGDQKSDKVSIELIQYGKNHYRKNSDIRVSDLHSIDLEYGVAWINVVGLHDAGTISQLGESFGLHPLLLEDVLNTDQRPKYSEVESHLAFFLKMIRVDEGATNLKTEQVSIILGKNYIISFQEVNGDVFDPVRNRLEKPTTKIRNRKNDYLAFALLDLLVDNYIVSIEFLGDKVEMLIAEMIKSQKRTQLRQLNDYKQEIIALRRIIRPLPEMCKMFEKSDSKLVAAETLPFIKDLEDHSFHSADALELYKELINDEISLYHANASSRLNEIMRVLTIFSVVFIPLTFIAGVYGMNFDYIPELKYRYAYPIFWGAIIALTLVMLLYFKKKKWL